MKILKSWLERRRLRKQIRNWFIKRVNGLEAEQGRGPYWNRWNIGVWKKELGFWYDHPEQWMGEIDGTAERRLKELEASTSCDEEAMKGEMTTEEPPKEKKGRAWKEPFKAVFTEAEFNEKHNGILYCEEEPPYPDGYIIIVEFADRPSVCSIHTKKGKPGFWLVSTQASHRMMSEQLQKLGYPPMPAVDDLEGQKIYMDRMFAEKLAGIPFRKG